MTQTLPRSLRVPPPLAERIEAHRDGGESGAELLNRVLAAGVDTLDVARAHGARPELVSDYPDIFTVPMVDPKTDNVWVRMDEADHVYGRKLVSNHEAHLEFAVVGLALWTKEPPRDDPSFFVPWIDELREGGERCALPEGFQDEGLSLGRWLVAPGGNIRLPKTRRMHEAGGWWDGTPSLSRIVYCRHPNRVTAHVRTCAPKTRLPTGELTPFRLSLVCCRLADGPLFEIVPPWRPKL